MSVTFTLFFVLDYSPVSAPSHHLIFYTLLSTHHPAGAKVIGVVEWNGSVYNAAGLNVDALKAHQASRVNILVPYSNWHVFSPAHPQPLWLTTPTPTPALYFFI